MKLVPITPELAATAPVQASVQLAEVCQSVLSMHVGGPPPFPWIGYLALDGDDYVGTCAFKSAPRDGKVEIAYFTFPGHEGRGIATWMAGALVELAAGHRAPIVEAQTLPTPGASTAILEKLGFVLHGTEHHPEDGPVWVWRKPLG